METPLIETRELKKYFPSKNGTIKALDGISLSLYDGEILALVGESGCGKSTFAKILLHLEEPSYGNVFFQGVDVTNTHPTKKQTREKQIIFQNPYASLNPRMTIYEILKEPFIIHKIPCSLEEIDALLKTVHLSSGSKSLFPHELSGGQRQRVTIARALALNPKFIVCDEPVSALDVSVSAQILNLLKTLQKEKNLSLLFISHDLRVVKYLSSRVGVMYLGHLLEIAKTEDLYKNPLHPYTKALLSSIPIPDPILERTRIKVPLQGEPPSPLTPPKGCPFAPRCPHATALCHEEKPKLKQISQNRSVSCHLI